MMKVSLCALLGLIWCGSTLAVSSQPVEVSPGVLYEKNVPIPTRDGSYVMANVFRPVSTDPQPAILFMSPYGKDLHTRDLHPAAWEDMQRRVPDLLSSSSGQYHTWETYDPEVWVPYGYVIVRIDSRGSGKSPGVIEALGRKQAEDYYDAIEWAARQPWSTGKIGMAGISYFSIIQWHVAALQPPHLAGFIAWEGSSDYYREFQRHGGILQNTFSTLWWKRQVVSTQHGNQDSGRHDLDDGQPLGGDTKLSQSQLQERRIDPLTIGLEHPLYDDYMAKYQVEFEEITAPFLSAANWGGLALHLRGNIEAFTRAASKQKWLTTHGSNHYVPFFSSEGQALQKAFFDHFLKDVDNGWEVQPPVMLSVRSPGERFERRMENQWPLAQTHWRKLYLDATTQSMGYVASRERSRASYLALENAVVFNTPPFAEETEITGPLALKLWVSSSTSDMDVFATLQLFDPEGKEVTFEGASEPAVPITQGWLRASQRKLDPDRSTEYRPYHSHDDSRPLVPNEIYPLNIELWPTSIVIPQGHSLALRIEGKDFSRSPDGGLRSGSGLFLHTHPKDRPPEIFGGTNTLYTGGKYNSYLYLPVIPPKS